jgi:hypothetical protein
MPSGVYDRTKSKLNTGVFKKGEHRNPNTEFKKGLHVSPKTEFGNKPSLSFQDRNCGTKEWRDKISKTLKGTHSSPRTEFKKGNHYSINTEFKELILGGVSSEESRFRNSPPYNEWRKSVFIRDNFTCQHCLRRGIPVNAHHIKHFAECIELRLDINNGVTLCWNCHRYYHSRDNILRKLKNEKQPDRILVLETRLKTLNELNSLSEIIKYGYRSYYLIYQEPMPRKVVMPNAK